MYCGWRGWISGLSPVILQAQLTTLNLRNKKSSRESVAEAIWKILKASRTIRCFKPSVQEEILAELRDLQRSSQKAGAAHARVTWKFEHNLDRIFVRTSDSSV